MTDLRYAVRSLSRVPAFFVAAVLSLTLGIATATTVFSLISAAMLRPLPFGQSDRLTVLNITQRTPLQGELRLRWSWPRFQLLQRSVSSFEELASSSNAVVTMTGVDDPEPLAIEIVSWRYHHLLRASFASGRGFTENDDAAASPVVIVGHDLWQRRFGGVPNIDGRELELNGIPLRVAGVTGPGFAGVSGLAQAWIHAAMAPAVTYRDYLTTNQNFITVTGRLRPGQSLEAARSELAIVGPRIHTAQPSEVDTPEDRFSATVMTLNEARIDVVTRRALMLLAGAVGVLLLLACANVASLLLGRAAGRRREISVRVAVGAGRARLVRQLLTESSVLAGVSCVLALGVVAWALPLVHIPATLARGRNFYGAVGEFAVPAIDWRVLAFSVAMSVFTVVLFGLVPALRATRTDVISDLKAGQAPVARGDRRWGLRELVVTLQVAMAVVLLIACGLLMTSYSRLRHATLGFDPGHLLTFMIRPSEVKYDPAAAPALIDRVLEEIGRVPGVVAATVDGCAPLSVQCASAPLHIVGRPWTNREAPSVLRHYVAPDHFETLGAQVLRGRTLAVSDRAGRPPVVVINEAAAERFWPTEDPIGQRIWFEGSPAFGRADDAAEIIGIVSNVAYQPLDEDPFQPGFYTHYAQFTYPTRMVLVRSQGEPLALVPEVASAMRRADPALALFDVQSMESRAQLSWSKHDFQTALFLVIGGMALFLAVTGVYAVVSYAVASRTREIGVRMAIGASDVQIARATMAHPVRLGVTGGAVGVLVALALSRVMRATLYDTSPLDAGAFAGALTVLAVALVIASYLPVRRALQVNPIDVLRSD